MALVSAFFWVAGLVLAVLMAPQLRIWTWGPAMLCFSLSALAALPLLWKERKNSGDLVIVISGFLLVSWLGIRAAATPVQELGHSDLLLVAMAAATFVSFRGISTSMPAQRLIIFGIAALTTASLYVLFRQVSEPDYSPLFPREDGHPSGFYAHYSYGASFLIAVSPLLLGLALHGKERVAIRLLLGLVAILGLIGVYYTRSRGAIVGAMGGMAVFLTFTLIIGRRDGRKWFVPAILSLPVLFAALGYILYATLAVTEKVRGGEDITGMLDNFLRFYMASMALSCFQLHPLIGGGARSYSWECYRFWDIASMGQTQLKPEHVHNELLQTATDYGAIGAGLLLTFLICVTIIVIYRTTTQKRSASIPFADGWRIGGIAGFAALFVQSNFEGIFRIAPGAVALAICLSAACFPHITPAAAGKIQFAWFRSGLATSVSVIAVILLFSFGIKGTRVSLILWPSYFSKPQTGKETKLDALDQAVSIWPLFTLYRDRAIVASKLVEEQASAETAAEFMRLSLADFERATELHPYDPAAFVSAGNLLSNMGRDKEAEANFAKAIELQGQMEGCFKSHFHAALHYQRKAMKEHDRNNLSDSLSDMQIATNHIRKAFELSHFYDGEQDRNSRILIHQNYGRLLETLGQPKEAMEVYDYAARTPYGRSSHYLAALLYGKLAVESWFDRGKPEDALYLFIKASERIRMAGTDFPNGVTPEQRTEQANYFMNSIDILKGGKVVPSESVDF